MPFWYATISVIVSDLNTKFIASTTFNKCSYLCNQPHLSLSFVYGSFILLFYLAYVFWFGLSGLDVNFE